MKTALLLSGHMRCWEKVYPNTKKHILDVYNPDVYIATWDNEGYWTSPENDPEGLGINKNSPKLDVTGVMEAYNPIHISVFQQAKYLPIFLKAAEKYEPISVKIRPQNIISQFFLRLALLEIYFQLDDTYNYDQIIYMRPDMEFLQELPKFDFNKLNLINHPNHEGLGFGDMFLATNQGGMAAYYAELAGMDDIVRKINRFCPHMITEEIAKIIYQFGGRDYRVHNIAKNLQHTPNGQYQDYVKGL
jgi:hypothetical protein